MLKNNNNITLKGIEFQRPGLGRGTKDPILCRRWPEARINSRKEDRERDSDVQVDLKT